MFNDIVGYFIGAGALIAGCGFAYSQFTSGAGKAKDDLIQTLKDTATAEADRASRLAEEKLTLIKSHQEQINTLSTQIGVLTERSEASEKRLKEYMEIFQGRNPEQTAFMQVVLTEIRKNQEAAPAVQKYMENTTAILGEIRTFMQELNEKAKNTEKWHDEIEEATAHDEGKPLRKKIGGQ